MKPIARYLILPLVLALLSGTAAADVKPNNTGWKVGDLVQFRFFCRTPDALKAIARASQKSSLAGNMEAQNAVAAGQCAMLPRVLGILKEIASERILFANTYSRIWKVQAVGGPVVYVWLRSKTGPKKTALEL